jgi:hypothetical protein
VANNAMLPVSRITWLKMMWKRSKNASSKLLARGVPTTHRSEQVDHYLKLLAAIDVSHQLESSEVRKLWSKGKQL